MHLAKSLEAVTTIKELLSTNKNTYLQEIANAIIKKFKDGIIKKIDKDNYLDIHLPSVNSKKGIVSKSQNSSTISLIYFVLLLPQLIIKTIAFSFQKYLFLVELLAQLQSYNL
jgi:hypothetical protein